MEDIPFLKKKKDTFKSASCNIPITDKAVS